MNLHGYSIYDRKALVYHSPFFAVADGAALRSFSDLANDADTTVGKHPSDYILFRVCTFDDATGELLPNAAIHIADANALVRQQPDLFRPNSNGRTDQDEPYIK